MIQKTPIHILYYGFAILSSIVALLSCSTVNEHQTRIIHPLRLSIDSNAFVLIKNYGNPIDSTISNNLYSLASNMQSKIDSLDHFVREIHGQKRILIVQQYATNSRSILLLSQNTHLNIEAFSRALVSYCKSRSLLISKLSKKIY